MHFAAVVREFATNLFGITSIHIAGIVSHHISKGTYLCKYGCVCARVLTKSWKELLL